MVTRIVIIKDIPSSDFYDGSGTKTITLIANKVAFNIKNNMIKIGRPKSARSQIIDNNDTPSRTVLDLKRIEETILVNGWIEDDDTDTAWNKVWILRGMAVAGNINGKGSRLTSLTVGGKTFNQANHMAAFIESFTFNLPVSDADIENRHTDSSGSDVNDIARIEFTMTLYMGEERVSS